MRRYILLICILLFVQSVTAQICIDTIPAGTPNSRFIVNGDEVTDTVTGLIWQRCSLGQTGNDCTGSASIYTWQQALQAGNNPPWRLPNIKELRSIGEEKCYMPAINQTIFPNTVISGYWSASTHALYPSFAWYVHFHHAGSQGFSKDYGFYVRLVRDE